MKTCVNCEKKAIFRCTECMVLMCKDHRADHLDEYLDHTLIKHKKIIPGVKDKIDPCTSKMNGLKQSYDEIINSDSVLAGKVEKSRNEAIRKIEQDRKQLLKFVGTLSNELTEEQAKIAEEKAMELQASFLLYQGQTPQNLKNMFTWYQVKILEEEAYVKFSNTQDTEEFQVIQYMALIESQETGLLSSDADCLRSPYMFRQRREKERFLEAKSRISRLESFLINFIEKVSEKVINADEILNDEQYIPPPSSLESELSIIYNSLQERLAITDRLSIRAEILQNFSTESTTEEISSFNQINNKLEKIELCNELLVLLKKAVFDNWCYYEDMKISSDGKYYFVCE